MTQEANHVSARAALAPIFARWQEADEDRPKILRAVLDIWGEAFWESVPKNMHARVKHYLEKTGWQRPTSTAPAKTDFDKAIHFFRKGAWTKLSDDEKRIISERYS